LWALGISGDLPILVLRIADVENLDIVKQLLQAHEYWRMKQFSVDLVILNEREASYLQDLQGALDTLARISQSRARSRDDEAKGRVFILRSDLIAPEARALLLAVARVVLRAQGERLADQLDRADDTR